MPVRPGRGISSLSPSLLLDKFLDFLITQCTFGFGLETAGGGPAAESQLSGERPPCCCRVCCCAGVGDKVW